MTNIENFYKGVHEATALTDKFLEASEDMESYSTFYNILGAINALYVVLGNYGEVPIDEVQRQVVEETKLMYEEEQ